VFDYYLAELIYRYRGVKIIKRIFLILSVCLNLGILVYFKYLNFLIDIYNNFEMSKVEFKDVFLPIGISFYTFQTMSYTIDVYRGRLKPAISFLDFAFYVSFFPQLVAGPIVRAIDFLPQIRKNTVITDYDVSRAVLLITGGLIKKAIISDYISVNYVDRIFDTPFMYSSFENIIGIYGYALQIYCDFSGYSDMAIGLSLLLGFRLNINFNLPYKAISMTDFWHRWHISLSSWLRDYLYIPLGGNRKGRIRQMVNLMITMLLGGLWHGANWKYVVWGGLHGIALVFEKIFYKSNSFVIFNSNRIYRFLRVLLTFHFVLFCWIFFRANNLGEAIGIIKYIFSSKISMDVVLGVLRANAVVVGIMLIGYLVHYVPEKIYKRIELAFARTPFIVKPILLSIVIWCIYQVKSADVRPFIYFQF